MTTNQQALIQLLGTGLNGKIPRRYHFDGLNWTKLQEEASNQTVTGQVWGAIEYLHSLTSESSNVLHMSPYNKMEWFVQTLILVERNKAVNAALCAIVKALDKAGIPCILLKGQGCASFYPNPLYRSPGDIDLLVGKANFHRAKEVLDMNGLASEWKHEDMIHGLFNCMGVSVELHKMATILPDPKANARFQKAMKDCLNAYYHNCPQIRINDTPVTLLPIELNVVYTFIHMFRHFIGGGIKLRQVMDWLMLYKNMTHKGGEPFYEPTVEEYLKSFGFESPWRKFWEMTEEYFGTSDTSKPRPSKTSETIMKMLLEGDITSMTVDKKHWWNGIGQLLTLYGSYFRAFRIFPRECIALLGCLVKINVQKNLLHKI